jgi:hypothetical protein
MIFASVSLIIVTTKLDAVTEILRRFSRLWEISLT